jgi:hypothetical protein
MRRVGKSMLTVAAFAGSRGCPGNAVAATKARSAENRMRLRAFWLSP